MKATSKASQDKAAAKKARRAPKHEAVLDSSQAVATGADTAGRSQRHDKYSGTGKEEAAAASGERQQSKPAQEAAASVSNIAAEEPSVSSASIAGEGSKQQIQNKQGIGSKRDSEENSNSSTTKRLKASTDSPGGDKIGTQGGSATDTQTEQTNVAGNSSSAAVSTHMDSSSGTDSAGSTSTSQQLQHQQHADSSTQGRLQTVDWLLTKYKDVAAAADQQVHKNCKTCSVLVV